MSILIKGMDMPIKGSYTVTIHSDGRVTAIATLPLRHEFVVGKAVEIPVGEFLDEVKKRREEE